MTDFLMPWRRPGLAQAAREYVTALSVTRAVMPGEFATLARECGGCGARPGEMCLAGTGLPASVPCPERVSG